MSSSGTPSFAPAENPDAPGRGPLIMGLTWTMTSLTIIVLTVRFYVRSKARLLAAEDWTIIIAGVSPHAIILRKVRADPGGLGIASGMASIFLH